jgi:hypothetical protein
MNQVEPPCSSYGVTAYQGLQAPCTPPGRPWRTPAKGYLQMQIDFINGQSFRRRLASAHLSLAGNADSFSFWACGATNLPLPLALPDQAVTATRQLLYLYLSPDVRGWQLAVKNISSRVSIDTPHCSLTTSKGLGEFTVLFFIK